jgi:hypothetical protein
MDEIKMQHTYVLHFDLQEVREGSSFNAKALHLHEEK